VYYTIVHCPYYPLYVRTVEHCFYNKLPIPFYVSVSFVVCRNSCTQLHPIPKIRVRAGSVVILGLRSGVRFKVRANARVRVSVWIGFSVEVEVKFRVRVTVKVRDNVLVIVSNRVMVGIRVMVITVSVSIMVRLNLPPPFAAIGL